MQLQLHKDFDPLWRLYSRSSSLTYIIYEFATGRNALNQAKFCCFLLCAKIAHVITITYISESFHLGSFHKLMYAWPSFLGVWHGIYTFPVKEKKLMFGERCLLINYEFMQKNSDF